ncbi:sugar transferase [Silicimonas algicola]|uniref:Lipopolysaccharide/colanic/teichoic acid biosynthesis glycosyltransferase n=2 Tax=Silicimonas algicola TaxID=1826607 RepID=A0A316GFR2_9RHOB|nr:sugar transferase [Silicimonas algicola]PWK58210.1 lipopolysaccharide/colanic/teichoic acid biosynthesis glycosyltransferase [Silicimonas algicola]
MPYPFLKRVLDLAFVAAAAAPLTIIAPFIAAAIYLEDRGPVFYAHKRTGKGGKTFRMLKFRTMVPDADERKGEIIHLNECRGSFKMTNDPRITRVGRFLRVTSLDEIPQLLNVLMGHMTLVGPRACSVPAQDYAAYQLKRLDVAPGVIGPAQIWIRHAHFDEKVELELVYLDRQSLKLDIYLLFRALLVLLRPNGV